MDRISVQLSLGGHGLLSADDAIASEHVALYLYLKDHTDVLMNKCYH